VLRQSAPLSYAVFGILFGGFGLIFVWVFFPWNFLYDFKLRAADTAETEGRIVAMAKTTLMINKKQVILFAFDFRTPTGETIHSHCYTTGRRWIPGDQVQVRYRPEDPAIACPVDGRLSRSTLGMSFVVVFPLVGAALCAWVMIARRRSLDLYRHGLALETSVVDLEHTQTAINDYPVYKATFQRVDLPRNPSIELRHWQPKVVAFLQRRLQNKQPVFLICDPRKPSRCLLPEVM
jgi:hypothetical protein